MILLSTLLKKISVAKWWLIAQLFGTAALIALSVLWFRLSDQHAGQLVLIVLLGLVIVLGSLALETATIRRLVGGSEKKTNFFFAALWLIGVGVVAWITWHIVSYYEGMSDLWSGYLNSILPAGKFRSVTLSQEHIQSAFDFIFWLVRWVVVPGLLLPLAAVLSVDGIKLPTRAGLAYLKAKRWWIKILGIALVLLLLMSSVFHWVLLLSAVGLLPLDWPRIRRVWRDWRWWPVVVLVGYSATHWILRAFTGPHGSPSAQVTAVIWKTVFSYFVFLLTILLSLIWVAVLLTKKDGSAPSDEAKVPAKLTDPDGQLTATAEL